MDKKLKLSDYIEKIYKDYAMYVLSSRSIPDWTGLKRSQVKILWVANNHCRKNTKTLAFSGAVVLHGGYHHSPDALADTIEKMAQCFAGANNYSLFNGIGSFGCQTMPNSIAASRYTEVCLSENFDIIFPKDDFNIMPKSIDPENPEPMFMLPIIPISLLNGINGIAIGYSVKMFPRSIKALTKTIECILKNKKIDSDSLLPWFKDFNGEISKDSNNNIIMKGIIQKLPKNQIVITEIPLYKYDLVSYKEFLYKLKDNSKINSFVDESDGKWKISVKVPEAVYNKTEDELMDIFDLKSKLNENITIIGMDGNVKVFDGVESYLRYFVECRRGFYDLRKEYLLNENAKSLLRLKIKKSIMSALKNGISKSELISVVEKDYSALKKYFKTIGYDLSEENFKDSVSNVVSNIKLTESLSDKKKEYDAEIAEYEKERQRIKDYDTTQMYIDDLKELKKLEK